VDHEMSSGSPRDRMPAHRHFPRGTFPVLRRIGWGVVVIFGVSLLTFFIVNQLPGDAALQLIGPDATPQQLARLEHSMHLDQPLPLRYLHWIQPALRGSLGTSLTSGEPVARLIGERLPVTLGLVGYALVLALGIAVPLALFVAHRPTSLVSRIGAGASILGLSTASYVLAPLLILVLSVRWALLPSMGYNSGAMGPAESIRFLTLPALSLSIPLAAFYFRYLRADLADQIRGADYVLAAAAKGLSPIRILLVHILRNSVLGLLTIVGLNIGTLIGATVVVEQIFALNGLGQLLLQSVELRDATVVQGVVLVLAAGSVVATMSVDVLCAAIDPRVRHA